LATVVAQAMKSRFGPALDLEIHLNDSAAALGYTLRGSTTVLVNDRWVPLDVATSQGRMAAYLVDLAK